MQLAIEHTTSAIIITIQSENLDASNVQFFKAQIADQLDHGKSILLNLAQLKLIDSAGISALLSCLRTMNNRNQALKLYAMAKPVHALFQLVHMHRLFTIYPNRDEALSSL